MRWKEFFYGQEQDEADAEIVAKESVFPKKNKTNLPPTSSKELDMCLTGIKGDILGTKPRRVFSNLTKTEKEALNELITLQKERKIVIKKADKGAAMVPGHFITGGFITGAFITADSSSALSSLSLIHI